MTCSYCQLAGCCSGIGACAANQKYLKAYLQRHPGKIVSGNLARQICNLGKQEEDARKLKEIKESLYCYPGLEGKLRRRFSGRSLKLQ